MPENPYVRLRQECRVWATAVLYPRSVRMFHFDGKAVTTRQTWRLDDLKERTCAANALDYDVKLSVEGDDGDLVVRYVKRPPPPPSAIG